MAAATPERLVALTTEVLEEARRRRTAFLDLSASTPWAEVLRAFDRLADPVRTALSRAGILTAVHPDAAVRAAAETLEQELTRFLSDLALDRELFDRLAAVQLGPEADEEDRRFLEHSLRDFRRAGVDRDAAARERIRALNEELVQVGQAFDRNIIQSTRSLVLAGGHAELGGLPEDFLASHPEAADGSVTLTTDPTDYLPVMLYATSDEVRRRLHHEKMNCAHPENVSVLARLLELRHRLAGELGHACWADHVSADKMTGSSAAIGAFVDRIAALARPAAEREAAELLELLRRDDPGAQRVELHQHRYLVEQVKRERLHFDSQEARAYFSYERVLQGVLDTTAALYGVAFRPFEDPDAWHADVRSFELLEDGQVVGRLHLDMHPRPGKYKHAAQFDLGNAIRGERLPEGALVCNFPQPRAGDPALMMPDQVWTLFHEFGHLMHHLLATRSRYVRFTGISCEWDFVEVPSQLYEEWCWNHAVLASFARHHRTDEPIPAELLGRMRAADEVGKGLHVCVQMTYASISHRLHAGDPSGVDVDELVRTCRRERTPFEEAPDTHFQSAFGHLHGYSALYYTYAWSDVIVRDLWSTFEGAPMERGTADRYRREVLGPGGSRDAARLVESFLGRPYRFDAWEAWVRGEAAAGKS